ncbi:hypothetical protein C0033_20370 [Clostridium sp. chh4-2]|uniref:hypothetical protein n=1 Tax=Clostridium sp. chh4-2 TaxID=2067550 RepID=UPI000CCE2B39|nr:hypothetical protein [Clostridium sp. chh4-2]PNV60200.1 hypothetical protein C0033_20370 [Clostridium sp. chh4-2]
MAALVCDICGGKLVMGVGGIAVCDSCGLEHSADRLKEKVQEIKGIVRVDNSHMIENYMEIAKSAKDAGNEAEAEAYCNKVIEIEPTNYRAWMLKGEAAAWQSSLQNSRLDEGVSAFIKAINNAPDEVKEDLIEEAKEQIKNLAVAMISLRADHFAKWPDEEETNGLISEIVSLLDTIVLFISQTKALIPMEELMAPIANKINQSVVEAWQNVIWPEYNGDPDDSDDRAGKYEWQTFIERVGYCTLLVEKAISLCDRDDEDDIQRYENLIFLHNAAIDSCSWDYNITSWGKSWNKEWSLTDEAKNARRQLIRDYEEKIEAIKSVKAMEKAAKKAEKNRIKREKAQKRFDAYWAEHASEKVSLEAERKSLAEQIVTLEKEMENIPGETEKANIQEHINSLIAKQGTLGWFKGKEKRAVQEKLDAANAQLNVVSERMEATKQEIEKRIHILRTRSAEITSELKKAR